MALQILYFVPYNLLQPSASFSAISQKLLVSPVLKKLVFLNSPEEVGPQIRLSSCSTSVCSSFTQHIHSSWCSSSAHNAASLVHKLHLASCEEDEGFQYRLCG